MTFLFIDRVPNRKANKRKDLFIIRPPLKCSTATNFKQVPLWIG